MELNAQAYRTARSEGLKGKKMAQRIQEIKSDPERYAPNVHLAAQDASRYSTYTNATGSKLVDAIGKSDALPLKITIPFSRTPYNILKFAFERTPLAFGMKSVRDDLMGRNGLARRDLAWARLSLGMASMITVGMYAADGTITGGGPADYRMRAHMRNQGWQPYSVKIGDTYYSYGRLEPIGMMLGLAADAVEVWGELGESEREDVAATLVAAVSRNVMSKTWLRGLSEAVEAFNDPVRYGDRWAQKLAGTIVPTGVAQVERYVSPELEDVRSYLDGIRARIPGYSKDLPVRRNIWGEPIVLEGGLGPDLISPIYTSKKRLSPIDNELVRLRAPISMPRRMQSLEPGMPPMRLEPAEYERLLILMNDQKFGGRKLKDHLNHLIETPRYKKASDEIKEDMIKHYIKAAQDRAKVALVDENQNLREILDAKRDMMRRQAVAQ